MSMASVEDISSGEKLLEALRSTRNKKRIKKWLKQLTRKELGTKPEQDSKKSSENIDFATKTSRSTMKDVEKFKILEICKNANSILQEQREKYNVLTCCVVGKDNDATDNGNERICCIVGRLLEMKLDKEAKALLDHCVLKNEKYYKIDHQFLLRKKNGPCRRSLKRICDGEGSDDHPLQTHPVVLHLLKSRWDESCFFTLSTAIVQLTFCIHLANYVMRVQAGCGNASNCSITQELCKNNSDCSELDCTQLYRDDEYYRPPQFSGAFLLVSALLLISHEVLQVMFQYRKSLFEHETDESSSMGNQSRESSAIPSSAAQSVQQNVHAKKKPQRRSNIVHLFVVLKNHFFDLENLVQLAVILAVFGFVIIPGLFHNILYSNRSINSTTGLNGQDITSLHAATTQTSLLAGVRIQPTASCSVEVPTTCDEWNNSLVEPLAITILIATLLLVSQLRKLGSGGEFVFMLKKITRSYLTHSTFITLAVFGFAIAFQMVIRVDSDLTFYSMPHAFLKTLVMLTGEYDYSDNIAKKAANDIDYENPHNSVAGPMFAVFLVVMVIIVQNLLTGVALEDVRAVHLSAVKERLRLLIETDREIWYFMTLFIKVNERFLKRPQKPQPEEPEEHEKHENPRMEQPNYEEKDESSRAWDFSCYAIFIAYPVASVLLIWAKSCCEIEYLTERYESKTVSIETFYNILDYGFLLALPIFLIVYPLIIPYYRLWRKTKTTTACDEKEMQFIGREKLQRLEENILKNLGASIMSRKQPEITINDVERMQDGMEKRMKAWMKGKMEKRMKVWMEDKMETLCQNVANSVNRKEIRHSAIQTDEQQVSLERRTTSQSEIDKLLSDIPDVGPFGPIDN